MALKNLTVGSTDGRLNQRGTQHRSEKPQELQEPWYQELLKIKGKRTKQ